MSVNDPFVRIKDIIKDDAYDVKFQSITLYGVLTYISLPKLTKLNCYSVNITLIDNSCESDDRLKCITFSGDISKSINQLCKKGDILRFHRFKIQKYNGQPQGLSTNYSSWVAFDKDANDFQTRTNKETISSLNDQDFRIVKELRGWLKTNPNVNAWYDLPTNNDQINGSMNSKTTNDSTVINDASSTKFSSLSILPEKGYFNMVFQICGICSFKNRKLLVCWDGTQAKINVHKEDSFKTESDSFLLISDMSYYFQIYIFDEYEALLTTLDLKPGDFISVINLRSDLPPVLGKTVIKLSGNGQSYGRQTLINKLTQEMIDNSNNEIKNIIKRIHKKSIELNSILLTNDQLKDVGGHSANNQTRNCNSHFNIINEKEITCERRIDDLLEDEEDAYSQIDNSFLNTINDNNENDFSSRTSTYNTENITNCNVKKKNNNFFERRTIKNMVLRLAKHTFFTKIELKETFGNGITRETINLNELHDSVSSNNSSNIKCKSVAKIFNYYTVNNPLITFVNVYCQICNYQNALPFHFVNVFEPNIASKLYLIKDYDENVSKKFNNQEFKSYVYKQSFNVDWLFEAKPSNIVSISTESSENQITSFYYDCPRCYWMNKKSNQLDYRYRFAFTLIDNNKFKLGPCLIENDIALKYVNISPLEFCCVPEQAVKVSDSIFNMLNKEALFELEAFNQKDDETISLKEKVIYKIKNIQFKKLI